MSTREHGIALAELYRDGVAGPRPHKLTKMLRGIPRAKAPEPTGSTANAAAVV
jgi:hypothetical protein